jgi:hypothetical protein
MMSKDGLSYKAAQGGKQPAPLYGEAMLLFDDAPRGPGCRMGSVQGAQQGDE